jgi:hypothetical protein
MRLLEALRIQAAKIAADLDNSRLFTHMGDRGAFREEIIGSSGEFVGESGKSVAVNPPAPGGGFAPATL